MLIKLLKHEIMATGRMFLPIYIGTLILTPLLALLIRFADIEDEMGVLSVLFGMSIFGYVVMLIGIFIASFIFIVVRFYKSMTTEEGYLTFTLPVKISNIILSKLIPATIFMVLTYILFFVSLIIFTAILTAGTYSLTRLWEEILFLLPEFDGFGMRILSTGLLFILSSVVSLVILVLQIYFSLAIGQLVNSYRLLLSVGVFIGTFLVIWFISMLLYLPFQNNYDLTMYSSFYESATQQFDYLDLATLIGLAINVVVGIGLYVPTWFIFKKKLNLE
ncbi:MAG: hypothetical protein LBR68_07455 [Lachnoclostridium sp.]|jgi:hypothetical protein|nr:hypothetical protein [Lachnoclostridium sp.]